jgi:chaperonin GroEL (HSP60 family)
MTDLLTDAEHTAMATTVALANQLAEIVGDGSTSHGDIAEVVHHLHAIQRTILAQAAARAYPDRYRLLGRVIDRPAAPQWLIDALRRDPVPEVPA